MAERRLQGLQRVLGTNALFSTAYGSVGSSIYYALGLIAGLALGLTPVVFLLTGLFFFCTAATYAEATAMFPEAGGSSSFARRAFNELVSFLAAWAQLLTYVMTVAICAFFVPHYVGELVWEPLRSSPGDVLAGIGVVAFLVAVNVRGLTEPARARIAIAAVDLLTQILLVGLGAVLVLSPDVLVDNVDLGDAPTWTDFLLAIPIGMIAYTGVETVSNLAAEAKDEATTIPAALGRVRLTVFAIFFTLPVVALSALPVERDPATGEAFTLLGRPGEEGGFAGEPVLGVVEALDLGVAQGAAEVYVGLLAATILLLAAHAGLAGVSRLVLAMGTHRQVPDPLRRLHRSYGTPWLGLVGSGLIAMVALLPGDALFLANAYAFGAMLSFTVAHVSLLALRRRLPDAERPYTSPWNVTVRGVRIPLAAVLGAAGTALAFVVVTALNVEILVVGGGWLVLGTVLYTAYRRLQGLDLTTTKKVAVEGPVVEHEAEYESVLVHFDSRRYRPGAIAMAQKIAARRRRGIHVLVTIDVPASSPLDDELPEQELAAQAIIEQAKLQAGRRATGHVERVRPGQAGRLIVDEARAIGARAIVLPLPPRGVGGTVFNRTLETVLTERPCRVIIHSDPADAAAGGRRVIRR